MKTEQAAPQADGRVTKRLASAYEWISTCIGALLLLAFVYVFAFRVVSVSGDSMNNTLRHGDRLLLLSGMFYTPERGDIVVIHYQNEQPLIKRVIAVGGDRISIDEKTGLVVLNGTPIEEAYVREGYTPTFEFAGELEVPEGYIFAMGDNRGDSLDSRSLGAFSEREIVGEVFFRLSPHAGVLRNGDGVYGDQSP